MLLDFNGINDSAQLIKRYNVGANVGMQMKGHFDKGSLCNARF